MAMNMMNAAPQLNTFNSSIAGGMVYPSQQALGNITKTDYLETTHGFERSMWTGYSVYDDPFYNITGLKINSTQSGQVLRVEEYSNVTLWTLPPQTSLSRILYTTETLNGTIIPASAYVLWPYAARKYNGVQGVPVVGFAHGTTGLVGECAPSHLRNLWYQYHGPFPLAIQGHAVVAPDYSGLGIDSYNGTFIPHHWSASPEGANNLMDAVAAAQKAFTELSQEFVVIGHSEGGGIAWAAAERQAQRPLPGYRGAVTASPLSTLDWYMQQSTAMSNQAQIGFPVMAIAHTLDSVYPEFQLSDWLTPDGIKALEIYLNISGCQPVANEVLYTPGINYVRPNWTESWYAQTWNNNTLQRGGSVPFAGPLLVLQGLGDMIINETATSARVNATCAAHPDGALDYRLFPGADHVPTMYAGQATWLDWIADRFNNVSRPAPGCDVQTVQPVRSNLKGYTPQLNHFMEYALYQYEVV